jgi:peptide-methionine (S)-S-oxide reductase
MEIAKRVTNELQQLIDAKKITQYTDKKVTTAITSAFPFYPAQEDHQEYLDKNPWGYCNHGYRFMTWPNL